MKKTIIGTLLLFAFAGNLELQAQNDSQNTADGNNQEQYSAPSMEHDPMIKILHGVLTSEGLEEDPNHLTVVKGLKTMMQMRKKAAKRLAGILQEAKRDYISLNEMTRNRDQYEESLNKVVAITGLGIHRKEDNGKWKGMDFASSGLVYEKSNGVSWVVLYYDGLVSNGTAFWNGMAHSYSARDPFEATANAINNASLDQELANSRSGGFSLEFCSVEDFDYFCSVLMEFAQSE